MTKPTPEEVRELALDIIAAREAAGREELVDGDPATSFSLEMRRIARSFGVFWLVVDEGYRHLTAEEVRLPEFTATLSRGRYDRLRERTPRRAVVAPTADELRELALDRVAARVASGRTSIERGDPAVHVKQVFFACCSPTTKEKEEKEVRHATADEVCAAKWPALFGISFTGGHERAAFDALRSATPGRARRQSPVCASVRPDGCYVCSLDHRHAGPHRAFVAHDLLGSEVCEPWEEATEPAPAAQAAECRGGVEERAYREELLRRRAEAGFEVGQPKPSVGVEVKVTCPEEFREEVRRAAQRRAEDAPRLVAFAPDGFVVETSDGYKVEMPAGLSTWRARPRLRLAWYVALPALTAAAAGVGALVGVLS